MVLWTRRGSPEPEPELCSISSDNVEVPVQYRSLKGQFIIQVVYGIVHNTEVYGIVHNKTEVYGIVYNNTKVYGIVHNNTEIYGIVHTTIQRFME